MWFTDIKYKISLRIGLPLKREWQWSPQVMTQVFLFYIQETVIPEKHIEKVSAQIPTPSDAGVETTVDPPR